jgi:hypothetical protein
VAAVSGNESDGTFLVDRDPNLPYPVSCFPKRQILRLEVRNPLPRAWREDEELLQFLREHGWVLESGGVVRSQAELNSLDNPANGAPNNALAHVFEWLLDNRRAEALGAFSIGPTQIYLRGSPATHVPGGWSQPAWGETVEDIFAFYAARDVQSLMDTGFLDYLRIDAAAYPTTASRACHGPGTCSSLPAGCVEKYLTCYQTGEVPWDERVWINYADGFKANLDAVWAQAAGLNYT